MCNTGVVIWTRRLSFYRSAIEADSTYMAAYNDLAEVYEAKQSADPARQRVVHPSA